MGQKVKSAIDETREYTDWKRCTCCRHFGNMQFDWDGDFKFVKYKDCEYVPNTSWWRKKEDCEKAESPKPPAEEDSKPNFVIISDPVKEEVNTKKQVTIQTDYISDKAPEPVQIVEPIECLKEKPMSILQQRRAALNQLSLAALLKGAIQDIQARNDMKQRPYEVIQQMRVPDSSEQVPYSESDYDTDSPDNNQTYEQNQMAQNDAKYDAGYYQDDWQNEYVDQLCDAEWYDNDDYDNNAAVEAINNWKTSIDENMMMQRVPSQG